MARTTPPTATSQRPQQLFGVRLTTAATARVARLEPILVDLANDAGDGGRRAIGDLNQPRLATRFDYLGAGPLVEHPQELINRVEVVRLSIDDQRIEPHIRHNIDRRRTEPAASP